MEIEQSQNRGGGAEKGWSGMDFARDSLVIQYLTPLSPLLDCASRDQG